MSIRRALGLIGGEGRYAGRLSGPGFKVNGPTTWVGRTRTSVLNIKLGGGAKRRSSLI